MHKVIFHYHYRDVDYVCSVDDGVEFLKILRLEKDHDLPLVVNELDDKLDRFVQKDGKEN